MASSDTDLMFQFCLPNVHLITVFLCPVTDFHLYLFIAENVLGSNNNHKIIAKDEVDAFGSIPFNPISHQGMISIIYNSINMLYNVFGSIPL